MEGLDLGKNSVEGFSFLTQNTVYAVQLYLDRIQCVTHSRGGLAKNSNIRLTFSGVYLNQVSDIVKFLYGLHVSAFFAG